MQVSKQEYSECLDSQLYVERICALCEGEGCWFCNQTGAVQVQVTSTEFYKNDK